MSVAKTQGELFPDQHAYLQRLLAARREEADDAEVALLEALRLAGITLPSVGVDRAAGRRTGFYLVDLGSARPDVVAQLAAVIRVGAETRLAEPKAGAI
jgi:hypothetical protein